MMMSSGSSRAYRGSTPLPNISNSHGDENDDGGEDDGGDDDNDDDVGDDNSI